MHGPYHASKFALEALSDALRLELSPWDVKVVVVEPGTIATPIWETSLARADGLMAEMPEHARELYGGQYEATRQRALRTGQQGIPPERVAKVIARALTVANPRARYLVGRNAQIAARIAMLPAWVKDRLLRPASGVRPSKNVPARRPRSTSS
jgi:NAD(P)-dependent dehydrogenase (short-subunit alcohol dehydrogenase family)